MKPPDYLRLLEAMSKVGLVSDTDSHMDRILAYLICISIARRAHKLERAPLRGLTRRQSAYWLKQIALRDVVEGMRSLGISAESPEAELLEARKRLLLQLLNLMMPPTGRPKKPRGGIMVQSLPASPKRLSGRPLSIPLDEEQQWVRAVMGVKIALWAQMKGWDRSQFRFVLWRLWYHGGLEELNREISDAEALRSTWLADRSPPAKTQEALRRRLNRARQWYRPPD